jgi:CHAT domain
MRRIDGSRVLVLEDGQSLKQVRGLGSRYDAVVFEHKGDWHLLPISEWGKLKLRSKPTFKAEGVFGARTRVKTVPVGVKPSRPAIVVNAAGNISGAWLPEPIAEKVQKAGGKRPRTGGSGPLRGVGSSRRRSLRGPAAPEGSRGRTVSGGGSGGNANGEGGEGATSAGAPETNAISRTPHLDAPDEIAKKPGTEIIVRVYVNKEDLRPGESGKGIELDLPADVDSIEVKVLLQCVGPFELVEGSEFRRLTIARDEDESKKLEFKLRVIPMEEEPGPVAISALFNLRGRACGQVARSWDWAAPGDVAPAIKPKADAPVSMPLYIKAEQPSLSIIISAPAGGTKYKCVVEAPALEGYEGLGKSHDFELPPNADKFRQNLLKALTDESRTSAARLRALDKIGRDNWEAAPQIVRDVFWEMIDRKVPPTTINVASVEPTLCWELMTPKRQGDREPRRLGPLGVEFAIGRWTRDEVIPPSPYLEVDHSFVIAPTYPKAKALDFEAELNLIETKLHGERIKPATIADLDERFRTAHASLLHFVCHGEAKNEDDAILLDGGELLQAGELESLKGLAELCDAKHPLVFLNSCTTGQMVPSLAGGAGFPRSFGDMGAKAIIAPLWPVDDKLASKIALELYEEALKPKAKSLAEIFQRIRKRGYEEEDADTYAAYCFFGDPHARLELAR